MNNPLPFAPVFALGLALVLPSLRAEVVINEIHYDPEPKTEFVEFIELHNPGADPVAMGGWHFGDGVSFTFPAGTTLAAGGYLLAAEDPGGLAAKFTIPPGTQVFQYLGSLANDGEKIKLLDAAELDADKVDYRSEFPWPIAPNGEGDSMQLINPSIDNNLGGAWRAGLPTPGLANSAVFAVNPPPRIRQVDHSPKMPASDLPTLVTAKITDPDGVASVSLFYQVVASGAYIPAFLPHSYSTLTGSPGTPLSPNPAFENPSNWTEIAMNDDGIGGDAMAGDSIYTATVPSQANRSLIRYRIVAEDVSAQSVRVPYLDDPSLNFAYFVYDGVPAWTADQNSVHPEGAGHSYSSEMLTSIPVYTMITRDDDRRHAYAYSSTGDGGWQIPQGNAARRVYNWECTLVYDGIVYDHLGWRLRQNNDRYYGNGKRSMRYRFNRGHYFQARDEQGGKLNVKWRRMSTSKMSRFGGTNSFGFHETINSKLWRMLGVECPLFLPVHFRMIDGADEAPDQYGGDFFGLSTVMQDIDGRLLNDRGLPDGNMYKLKDGETNPLELQRNQARDAVTDGSDFLNIRNNLGPSRTDAWLRDHVDWDQWARYHAVVEAVRHYDYGTPSSHWKNRAWYFKPELGTPHGLLRVVPHDHDASWYVGYHDSLNSTGDAIGTGFPWRAIFGGSTRPPAGPEKSDFTRDYRNVIREFRDLLWQEETVNTIIDDHAALLAEFSLADRDRWTGGPATAGVESMTAIGNIAEPMKSFAFVNDIMYGTDLPGGRAAFLDQIAADTGIPDTPTIQYIGDTNYPINGLSFQCSEFNDPQGAGTFGKIEWRIGEVSGLSEALVSSGDTWKYFDGGTDPGATWAQPSYDDDNSAWGSGPTQIGYGESDQATTVAGGHATTYFRKVITISDPALYASFDAGVIRDDGAIVYVNGVEVWRNQMPAGTVTHTTVANESASSGSNETDFHPFTISPERFVPGDNTIAVEVHQITPASGDMSFDLQLIANPVTSVTPERIFEWAAAWESGELTPFQDTIFLPPVAAKVGRSYRARVRHADATGHWSHWSTPVEFSTTEPSTAGAMISHLRISEVMYDSPDGSDFEFVELHNISTSLTLDLGGAAFTEGIDYNFPGGTTIAPGGYLLVVGNTNAAAFRTHYGLDAGVPVAGPYEGKLSNGGEELKFKTAPGGSVVAEFGYGNGRTWPLAAAGAGHSLVPIDPTASGQATGALDYPGNWRASTYMGGSPGTADPTRPATTVVLNEITAHTDYSNPSKPEYDSNDWIELHNPSGTPISLAGWYLSDDPSNPNKWAIPAVSIPAGGYLVFNEVDDFHSPITSGFGLDKAGEQVLLSYLPGTAADRVVDAIGFKGQENGYSLSRYPNGTGYWHATDPSSAVANTTPLPSLRLTEVMYEPPLFGGLDNVRDEYIEILNSTASDVTMQTLAEAWRLNGGIEYTFPDNTVLSAGERMLVVSFDPADPATSNAFVAAYSITANVRLFGPYTGKLGNRSDRVTLEKPQLPDAVGEAYSWVIEDETVYGNQNPWPASAAGSGSSLERISMSQHGLDPANWHAAAPSPGAESSDRDGDGMPSDWEDTYSFDPGDPADATVDSDGDGFTNLEEYWSGTDPRDPENFLTFDWIGPTNAMIGLRFTAVADKTYTIQHRLDLETGAWQILTNLGAAASTESVNLTDPASATNNAGFYRLKIILQP